MLVHGLPLVHQDDGFRTGNTISPNLIDNGHHLSTVLVQPFFQLPTTILHKLPIEGILYELVSHFDGVINTFKLFEICI